MKEKNVLNKMYLSEVKVELLEVKVDLASLDMIKAMYNDSLNLYKKGQEYAKEMEAFTKKSKVLNAESKALSAGLSKELIEFNRQAKELGLDISTNADYKKANDSLGALDNLAQMTERFK